MRSYKRHWVLSCLLLLLLQMAESQPDSVQEDPYLSEEYGKFIEACLTQRLHKVSAALVHLLNAHPSVKLPELETRLRRLRTEVHIVDIPGLGRVRRRVITLPAIDPKEVATQMPIPCFLFGERPSFRFGDSFTNMQSSLKGRYHLPYTLGISTKATRELAMEDMDPSCADEAVNLERLAETGLPVVKVKDEEELTDADIRRWIEEFLVPLEGRNRFRLDSEFEGKILDYHSRHLSCFAKVKVQILDSKGKVLHTPSRVEILEEEAEDKKTK